MVLTSTYGMIKKIFTKFVISNILTWYNCKVLHRDVPWVIVDVRKPPSWYYG
jgi:hypothetical protein